ncbi:C-C chemokine receptor type 1-like [Scyliorhinus canicula]|uniref:C-C chemokine receptor type 1-like n=1 Tax=Scyliorhinus canicula TaxID=7830 RepID=UPI0018F2CFE4|nr:C-C chemokine receptor type 1-like [Scyliorhinus canicula]
MADLLVIIINLILTNIAYYYLPVTFLYITPVCSLKSVLLYAATDCSVWFTVAFTFDRFVTINCQKLKIKYCTGKIACVVLGTTSTLIFLQNLPLYFTMEPGVIINNVPWLCYTKTSYFTNPAWIGFSWFDQVLTPLLPFGLVLFINALTVRYILMSSRVRKGLRAQSNGENRRDPEMESRRKSIILLFAISGCFVLLWSVFVLEFFYYKFAGIVIISEAEHIVQKVGLMLQNLNCCTNTFIYVVTQSKFREQIKNAVKYPVALIIHSMKKQVK